MDFICSVVWSEAWGLVWKWGSLTSIISRAPSSSLAESGSSALPGLRALLGSLPVVRLRDSAVLIVGVGSSVSGPVVVPEGGGVVVLLPGGWDDGVSESNGGWDSIDVDELVVVVVVVSGLDGCKKSDGKEFHYNT